MPHYTQKGKLPSSARAVAARIPPINYENNETPNYLVHSSALLKIILQDLVVGGRKPLVPPGDRDVGEIRPISS